MRVSVNIRSILGLLFLSLAVIFSGVQHAQAQRFSQIDGEWQGSAWGSGNSRINFRFVAVTTGPGTFAGNMVEFNTFADQRFPELYARIDGKILDDGHVEFTKTYDGTAGVRHSVAYRGVLTREGLTGQWSLPEGTGSFEARPGVSGVALRLSAPVQPERGQGLIASHEPPAQAEPPSFPPLAEADITKWERDGVKSRTLSLRLQNLDDVGAALLVLPDGKHELIAAGEWSGAEGAGSSEAEFTDKLKVGPNTLVFFIYNKSFSFWVGKWTFDFQLYGDADSPIWTASGGAREENVGIRYWRAFTIIKDAKGLLTIKSMASNDLAVLEPVVESLHRRLLMEIPSADGAVMTAIASAFAGAMIADLTSGYTSSTPGGQYYYEQRGYSESSPAPSTPSTSGFYGNCHGGAFYGC
jgi:hypothetical protein